MYFGMNYRNQHRVTVDRMNEKYKDRTNLAIVGPCRSGKTNIIREEILGQLNHPDSYVLYVGYYWDVLCMGLSEKLDKTGKDNIRMYRPENIYDAIDFAKELSVSGAKVWVYFDDVDFYIKPEIEELQDFLYIAESFKIRCTVLMQEVEKESACLLDECHFKFIISGAGLKGLHLTASEKRFLNGKRNARGLLTYGAPLYTKDGIYFVKKHVAYVVREAVG